MGSTVPNDVELHAFMQLESPYKPAGLPPRTPYICSADYDGGDFMQYPLRAGWPQVIPDPSRPSFSNYDGAHPANDEAFADLVQRWLFFGLLKCVLKENFDQNRYISSDHEGQFVHTKHLNEDLSRISVHDLTRDYDNDTVRAYEIYLGYFRIAIDTLIVSARRQHSGFNRGIRQATAALCETLCLVVDKHLYPPNGSDMPMGWRMIYIDDLVTEEMNGRGWCRREATIGLRSFQTLSAVYFAHYMHRPRTGRDHSDCTPENCTGLEINDLTYRPAHVSECHCEEFKVDVAELGACLDASSGSLPLLRIRGQAVTDLEVGIESSTEHPAYVALSHVWADGLGNRNANALPRCQLLRLQAIVDSFKNFQPWQSAAQEDRELRLWCDTLCVPVYPRNEDDPQRLGWWQKAMQRMRHTYRESAYTLVLDKTLSVYSVAEIGLLEAAVRAFTSPWMHRLWTFQEGVLPSNLVFSFQDYVVDIRTFLNHAKTKRDNNAIPHGLYVDIIGWCQTLRGPFHSAARDAGADLASVTTSLRHRKVSYSADEALCVATLLNLDLDSIAQAPETVEARMSALWKQMPNARKGIPKDIIFNQLPRLASEGFRWAPSTLLYDLGAYSAVQTTQDNDPNLQGTLMTPHGLKVVYPGWRIGLGNDFMNLRSSFVGPVDSQQLRFRDAAGNWMWIMHVPQHLLSTNASLLDLLNSDSELVLLVDHAPTLEGPRYRNTVSGLLGCVNSTVDGVPRIMPLAVVRVESAAPNQQSFWDRAHGAAVLVRQRIQTAQSEGNLQQGALGNVAISILLQTSREVLDSDPALAAMMQLITSPEAVATLFAGQTSRFLVGMDIRELERFEDDSAWIIA